MPRYDCQCSNCAKILEVTAKDTKNLGRCDCGGRLEWVPGVRVAVFKPFVHPHIGHKPVLIESWRQYKDLLKANNLHNELAD